MPDVARTTFNASPGVGLYRQFGLPLKYAYIPLALQPTTAFYDAQQKLAKAGGSVVAEKKSPYYVEVPAVGSGFLALKFRFFPPSILSITARLKSLESRLSSVPVDSLFSLRNPRNIQDVRKYLDWSTQLVEGVEPGHIGSLISQVYTGFHLSGVDTADIPQYWRANRAQIVGLLIGNKDYNFMNEEIPDRVDGCSAFLNLKSTNDKLVLNRQGAIFVTPQGWQPDRHSDRLARAMDLAEIALVFQSFFDNIYPQARPGQENFLDYIFTRIKAWIEQPKAVLNVSYTNTLLWELLVSELGLREKLKLIENENPWLAEELAKKSAHFARVSSLWWQRPEFGASFLS